MTTYKIVIMGVAPGVQPSFAANQLALLFKTTPAKAAALLASGNQVVKSGVDAASASKYEAALRARGCACDAVPEDDDADGLSFDTPVSIGGSAAPVAQAASPAKPLQLSLGAEPVSALDPAIRSSQPSILTLVGGICFFLAMGIATKFMPGWIGTALSITSFLMAGVGSGGLMARRSPQRGFVGAVALICGVLLAGAGALLPFGVRSGDSAVAQAGSDENALEIALHIGVSTAAQMQAFKDAGGLNTVDSWKGYRVTRVETMTGDDGRLQMTLLTLGVQGKKMASMNNLKASLASECGTRWERGEANNLNWAVAPSATCSIGEKGPGYMEVGLTRRAPKPATAPIATTQSIPPMAAVSPAQFVGSYKGEGDGATVTADIGAGDVDGTMNVSIGAAGSGCAGSVEGGAKFEGPVLRLNARDRDLRCSATMQFNSAGQLVIEEGDGCSQFHGAQCTFGATLSKTSSKPETHSRPPVLQQQPQPSAFPQKSEVEVAGCMEAQARCRQKSPVMAQACLNALASVRGCD